MVCISNEQYKLTKHLLYLNTLVYYNSSDKKKIRHNLVDFLNAKLKARISEDSISLSMLSTVVIHEQKDIKQITREPKEAIMVTTNYFS